MRIIDLSHPLKPGMPVYPGTEPPLFEVGCTIAGDGFLERKITFFSHTGTHIDAPAHIFEDGDTLDRMPLERFHGPGCVVNVADLGSPTIETADLEKHQQMIAGSDFLLIRTGWSRFWGTAAYFENYPVLSVAAADWLCRFDLKGIGLDAISADVAGSKNLPVHHRLLGRGIVIVENLTNLAALSGLDFTFSCLPLKIEQADGSPVRAVALRVRTKINSRF